MIRRIVELAVAVLLSSDKRSIAHAATAMLDPGASLPAAFHRLAWDFARARVRASESEAREQELRQKLLRANQALATALNQRAELACAIARASVAVYGEDDEPIAVPAGNLAGGWTEELIEELVGAVKSLGEQAEENHVQTRALDEAHKVLDDHNVPREDAAGGDEGRLSLAGRVLLALATAEALQESRTRECAALQELLDREGA